MKDQSNENKKFKEGGLHLSKIERPFLIEDGQFMEDHCSHCYNLQIEEPYQDHCECECIDCENAIQHELECLRKQNGDGELD